MSSAATVIPFEKQSDKLTGRACGAVPFPDVGLARPVVGGEACGVVDQADASRRAMRTLAGVLACFGFFWGAWAVSVAEIKSALHVSDGQFGLLLSAALLAAAATNAVAGSLAERWGTRTALCRSLVAWAAK